MPFWTGVVQAGSRRPTPETSTTHRRQEPAGVRPSMVQSVGMYLSLARATSRIVSPSVAPHNSPSIRIEICLGIAAGSLSVLQGADITTQAATGLLGGLLGSE